MDDNPRQGRFPDRYRDPVSGQFFMLPPPPTMRTFRHSIFVELRQYRELQSSERVAWAEEGWADGSVAKCHNGNQCTDDLEQVQAC